MIGEGQDLDRKCLVDLDDADIINGQTGFGQRLFGGRDR